MAVIEVRAVDEDTFRSWVSLLGDTFGGDGTDEELARRVRDLVDLDRTLAAFEGAQVVGTAGSFAAPLTLPFGGRATVAGVTDVTVRPTHRRRGIMTRLMRHQLDSCHGRGEVLAGLWPSEAPIYGRFGYGAAAPSASLRIPRAASAFREPRRVSGVEEIDAASARRVLPAIQEAAAAGRPGFMVRPERVWDGDLWDQPARRRGAGRFRFVVHQGAAGPDGYAWYRTRSQWGADGERDSALEIVELNAVTPDAYATLWRYCLDVDLMVRIEAWDRAVDEPLAHLLQDARAMGMRVRDGFWLRLVDVAAALGRRGYGAEGELVLEVGDGFCPWNAGRWLLEAGQSEARVSPTTREPDLVLDAASLAALYLGGHRATTLRWVGALEERTPGAAERADRLFAAEAAPWNPTGF